MAILYKLEVTYPNWSNGSNIVPPTFNDLPWWKLHFQETFTSRINSGTSRIRQSIHIFSTIEEATNWFAATRLNPGNPDDAEILASLDEFKTAHGITITESWYEIPEITTDITGIFG